MYRNLSIGEELFCESEAGNVNELYAVVQCREEALIVGYVSRKISAAMFTVLLENQCSWASLLEQHHGQCLHELCKYIESCMQTIDCKMMKIYKIKILPKFPAMHILCPKTYMTMYRSNRTWGLSVWARNRTSSHG